MAATGDRTSTVSVTPASNASTAGKSFRARQQLPFAAFESVVMDTALKIRAGVNAIPGLKVLGQPDMSMMAVASDTLNIYEVGDEMAARGRIPPRFWSNIS